MNAIDRLCMDLAAEQGGGPLMPGASDELARDPDIYLEFFRFRQMVLEPGELSTSTKLAIVLGMMIVRGADRSAVMMYTNAAYHAGATVNQIREVLRLTMLIGGSPAVPYAGWVAQRLQELQSSENEVH